MSHQRFDLRLVADQELLERLGRLHQTSAEVMADLLCHLAEVEKRGLHLREATSSLFAYAVEILRCSEDEAWRRVHAARTAARFPVIFELIASGELTLTAVTKLEGLLTDENHAAVLAMARHKTKAQIEVLVATLAPSPDLATRVARVPDPARRAAVQPGLQLAVPAAASGDAGPTAAAAAATLQAQTTANCATAPTTVAPAAPAPRPARVQPLSPERWAVTVTIGAEAQRALETAKALTRRTALQGNTALIIERALIEFADRLEARRRGKLMGRTRSVVDTNALAAGVAEAANQTPDEQPHALGRDDAASTGVSGRDQPDALARNDAASTGLSAGDQPHALARNDAASTGLSAGDQPHAPARKAAPDGRAALSRSPGRRAPVPRAVVRAVCERDGNRCTYRSADGRRCTETEDLELHHIDPDACGGETTVENLTLHCARHNRYQAVLDFGAEHVATAIRRRREGGEFNRGAIHAQRQRCAGPPSG